MDLHLPGFGVWLAAFFSIAIFSFLYKDNLLYRFAESVFAGVSFGYYVGLAKMNTLDPNLIQPLRTDFLGHIDLLIPFALGVLLYARYIPRVAWISRWSLAVYIGYYIGVTLLQKLHGEVLPQAKGTMLPLTGAQGFGQLAGNLIVVAGVVTVLLYFYFSAPHTGPLKPATRVGVYFLMLSFGASFGYTVMGRISLLIGRLTFLVDEWARPILAVVFGL